MPPPAPKAPFVSDRPKKEAPGYPGYYLRSLNGFKLLVSRTAYEESDEAEGEPLKVIDDELTKIADVFDADRVKTLQRTPIWIEWDHTIPESVHAFAVYYGRTGQGLLFRGVDPRKEKCICVLSLKIANGLREKGALQNTLLHEYAHVVHDQYVYDINDKFIMNAYQQAIARRMYLDVRLSNGRIGRAYASTNYKEYFAELTCAYLDKLDYEPHDRKELKEYDSVGYEVMTKIWGSPEQIEERKKKAAAKRRKK